MSRTEHYVKFRHKRVKGKSGRRTITLAEFYSLPKSENPDLVAACDSGELKIMVKEAGKPEGYEIEGDEIIVYNDQLYEKLLIYATVRQGLRRPEKVIDLRETVKDLGIYETHFWASSFSEIYRQTSDRRLILRPAKAFKIFYRLVKK